MSVSLEFKAFDVLIIFWAANEKTGTRRPIPATFATSATLLFIITKPPVVGIAARAGAGLKSDTTTHSLVKF